MGFYCNRWQHRLIVKVPHTFCFLWVTQDLDNLNDELEDDPELAAYLQVNQCTCEHARFHSNVCCAFEQHAQGYIVLGVPMTRASQSSYSLVGHSRGPIVVRALS